MKTCILILLGIVFPAISCFGQSPEGRGHDIAVEADRRVSGYGDLSADMEMILRNREGRESRRLLQVRTMETPDDGDKSLTIFNSPGDVRGTALLTNSHTLGYDDQWLYLPALKRVKRITAANKAGSFMGSEFSFEDLGGLEVEKYTYTFLGEEILDGRRCFVVERYPVDKENSGYSRIVSWLDQEEYRVWKEDFYDRKNRLLKTLTLEEYGLYLDRFWKAHRMRMVNHQKARETDLLWSNFRFRTGLSDSDFDRNSLKRAR